MQLVIPFCFNSLQTGKCIQSEDLRMFGGEVPPVFQFPSNGKVYSKFYNYKRRCGHGRKFQFPSNGKVYSKVTIHSHRLNYVLFLVSIPFKRESVFKDFKNGKKSFRNRNRFNSLQTGKCIQRKEGKTSEGFS